jgi:hypothetical protein
MKMFSQVKWLKAFPGNIDRLAGAIFACYDATRFKRLADARRHMRAEKPFANARGAVSAL